jgi:L-alanine-DL-glutamate epimerase-like enolase superfamily enzyme
MGKPDFMRRQTEDLLESGYRVLKMKIGVVGLEDELSMLKDLRRRHSASQLELRVDANGAFRPDEARSVLDRLAQLEVHSIEQPIAPGQHDAMARLIVESPISVALDEELIGVHAAAEREALLQSLRPHYLILKPSLLGGFAACEDWIRRASTVSGPDAKPIGWWVTSMLESNIGLNAIAQWNFQLGNPVPCGLGTGSLYTNNLDSPLESGGGWLRFHPERSWDLSALEGTSEEGPDDVSADRPENSGRSPGNSPGKPSHKSPGESPSQSPSQSSGKPTSQS